MESSISDKNRGLPRKAYTARHNRLYPVVAGCIIALCTVAILKLPYVWAFLIVTGLIVAIASLVADDFRSYWLAVFALLLPLEIIKSLADQGYLREITNRYGIPLGEMPIPAIYLSDLPFIVLMLQWGYETITNRREIYFPKTNWLAVSFLGWASLSLFHAPVFSYAFFDLLRTIKFYLLFLYLANNITTEKRLKTFMNFLIIGVIFQGMICLYQFYSHDVSYIFGDLFGEKDLYKEEIVKKYPTFYAVSEVSEFQAKRASGTVGPTNAEAQYFELLLPVVFLLWVTSSKFREKTFYFFTCALGTAGLIVTFSRGGLVGLLIGLIGVICIAKGYRIISNKTFLSAAILALLVSVFLIPKIYHYAESRPESNKARFHLYKVGLDMIKAHPILGVGLNNHLIVAPDYDPDKYFFPMPTHNEYIRLASEVGIPGFLFFSGFLFSTCVIAARSLRFGNVYLKTLSAGLLGAFIAISMHNMVDHFSYHTNLTLLWLYAGLLAAMVRLNLHEEERLINGHRTR